MTCIVLHGLSATGKSMLGKKIAESLSLPFLSKDKYKEVMFDAMNMSSADLDWSRKVGGASFEVLYAVMDDLLASGTSFIVETYWNPAFASPRLRALFEKYNATCLQIFCYADFAVLKQRFDHRAQTDRHPSHMDLQRAFTEDPERNVPLDLPGTLLRIDTTDFNAVDIDAIIAKAKSLLQTSATK